jgi:hypothetical protein
LIFETSIKQDKRLSPLGSHPEAILVFVNISFPFHQQELYCSYMKRIIPLAILLVALISAFMWYHSTTTKVEVGQEVASESKEVAVIDQFILLYPESGEVLFKINPNDEFKKATTSPTIIPNQSIVHTGKGKASVLLPDNSSISLENDTEITVNYTPQAISVYQYLGTTYHRVEALITGKTYQVQTAGTLAAVRGTKFAVKYDTKTKKTKIAVTEHKVEVSSIPKTVGTTTIPAQTVFVEEGKTVSVEIKEGTQLGKPAPLAVIDTNKDPEMKAYVEMEKKVDDEFDALKKEHSDKEDFRKEMKRVLFDDEDDDLPKELEKKAEERTENKEELQKEIPDLETREQEDETNDEVITKPNPLIKTDEVERVTNVPVVTKVSEEEFFNAFEPLFIKYFYLDEVDSLCTIKVAPEERVRIVSSFAQSKGYPFTKPTLQPFAVALDEYCKIKDKGMKERLQGRFDDEYPF